MSKTKHCVLDAAHQVGRCEICGETIPIPLGSIPWVCGVIEAFCTAHKDCKGPREAGSMRTGFSVPVEAP